MATSGVSKVKVSNFKLILTEEDREFILKKTEEVLTSHRWTVGAIAEALEEEFKRYTGASHAVALVNGGAALVAILQALKIPEESVVLCPTLTAPPTPHSILNARMKVLFADSESQGLGLDPDDVKRKLKQHAGKVAAAITVHVGGWISPRIKDLHRLCQEHGIPLIEDCAHAHGSRLEGKHAGSTAASAAYSFFMTKPLPCGEGGMVTAEDEELVEAVRIIRNYGKDEDGKHVMRGFNYKLSEFNAVVALWACSRAPRLLQERRKIACRYDQLLKGLEGIRVFQVPGCECSYYKYIVTLDPNISRDKVKDSLFSDYGIEAAGGVYDTLCHEEPFFRSVPNDILNASEKFPQAERFARQQLCLPLYPGLTEEEQCLVVESLRKAIAAGSRERQR